MFYTVGAGILKAGFRVIHMNDISSGWLGEQCLDSCQLKWACCWEPFFTPSCSPFISMTLILLCMLVLFNLCWSNLCWWYYFILYFWFWFWFIENILLPFNVLQDASITPINLKLVLNANYVCCLQDWDNKIFQKNILASGLARNVRFNMIKGLSHEWMYKWMPTTIKWFIILSKAT